MNIVSSAIPIISGAIQSSSAQKAARELEDPTSFQLTPEQQKFGAETLRRYKEGMTPEEINLYMQNMARQTGAAERAMRNLGMGGLATGISSIYNLQGLQNLAAQNAQISRDALSQYGQFAGTSQQVSNFETQRANAFRDAKAEAIGKTQQSGMENIMKGVMGGIGGFGDLGTMAGYDQMYKGNWWEDADKSYQGQMKAGLGVMGLLDPTLGSILGMGQ